MNGKDGRVFVDYDPSRATVAAMMAAVRGAGFHPAGQRVRLKGQWPVLRRTRRVRLARREEARSLAEFGDLYARYASVTPGFYPAGDTAPSRASTLSRAPP